MTTAGQFTSDIEAVRKRAREHLEEGAVTPNYGGDVKTAIRLLNDAVAAEIVCMLRYRYHAIVATGIASDSVKVEFEQHARDEEQHMLWFAERIVIETYRDLIRFFAQNDPTTRVLIERVLAQEEDHANDMHDLLVAHEGEPMLQH